MINRITEDWLKEVFGKLFGLIDEQELRQINLSIIAKVEDPVDWISSFLSHRLCDPVIANLEWIPTDVKIDMEGITRIASAEKVSRLKGAMLHYEPMFSARNSGVTELSELWLLEDGRFAEITSICFIKDELVHVHRKFRKIIKRKKDIWFAAGNLVDSLYLMQMWYLEANSERC